jgi:hypothetical protein
MKKKSRNQFKTEDNNMFMKMNNADIWIKIDKEDVPKCMLFTWSQYKTKKYTYYGTTVNTKLETGKYTPTRIFLNRYLSNASKWQHVKYRDENHLNCMKSNLVVG